MTVLQVCVVEAPEGAPGKVLSTYRAPVLGPRVGAGDAVTAYDVIGVGTERSPLVLADVAQALGRGARSIAKSVTVSQGDVVRRGQKLAGASGPFGMRRREALSPTDGVVAAFVEQHGTLLLRPPDREDTIRSVLPGKVTAVSRETIAVETSVHLLEGLSGFGPQAAGTLMAAGSRIFEEEIVRREAAPESEHDPILVAVGQLELSLLERLLDRQLPGIVGFVCQGTSWMVFHEARRRWPDAAVMLTDGFGRRFGQEPASTIGDRIEALGGSPAVLIPQGVGEFRSSPLLLIAAGDHSPPVGAGGSEVDSLIRTLVGTEVQDVTVMESPVLVRRLDSGIDVESVEIRRENGEVRVAAVVNVKKPPKL